VVNAYRRKKQPELVRRALLDAAARLATEQGLAGVTIQAIADAVGVTKGGLLHHFPSKQALVDAVFANILEQLDAEIDAYMAVDDERQGSFTRAYVQAVFDDCERGSSGPWAGASVSLVMDPLLRRMWCAWLQARLERHRKTDGGLALEIVRRAADGVWMAYMLQTEGIPSVELPVLRAKLIAMTKAR
jgi:AcrR family transcriptional regulator